MRKKTALRSVLIAIVGLMACCGTITVGVRVYSRIWCPPPQILSHKGGICISCRGISGSSESAYIFTYECDSSPGDLDYIRGIWDREEYLDKVVTMECPMVWLRDDDGDGFSEVQIIQDRICKAFAHPAYEDPSELFFTVSEDGEFIGERYRPRVWLHLFCRRKSEPSRPSRTCLCGSGTPKSVVVADQVPS